MRRGFKAEAERVAETLRTELGAKVTAPTDLDALAVHIGAEVTSAGNLVDVAKLIQLERLQPGAFSACTLTLGSRNTIVFNPLSSEARRKSDIAHEIAHLILEHPIGVVKVVGEMTFFTCDPDEEQEANWMAGCVLLPRSMLIALAKQGFTAKRIAAEYGVSEQMATFRLRATGILRQLAASSRPR